MARLVELDNSSSRQVSQSRMDPRRVVYSPIARMVLIFSSTSIPNIIISVVLFLSLVFTCSSRRSPYHAIHHHRTSRLPSRLTPPLVKSSPCSNNPFLSTCSSLTLNRGSSSFDLGGGSLLPEDSVPARGRRERMFRRYHYLMYIKLVFSKLKKEYARLSFNLVHIVLLYTGTVREAFKTYKR